jgi:PIN domain nuclease of toxin-antitoxin system
MQPILLDTCAAIWLTRGEQLARPAVAALNEAIETGAPSYISPITAWEVGMLVARGRVKLLITPQRWFARLFEAPNVHLADMSADVLISSSFLPGSPPRDPTDRILAATAREYGAALMTRDRALLEYGEQGHVRIIAC